MNSGYYAACSGLRAQSQALELMANNLANVNTNGYLGEQPTFRSLMASPRAVTTNLVQRTINQFSTLGDTQTDLSSGNLQKTDGPFDLAIEGRGFFAVQTKAGTAYTRNGSFQVSPTGQLLTASGDAVLGEQGPITVPAGAPSISGDGTLSVNGAVAGKLRVVELADDAMVTPLGNSLYSVPDTSVGPATRSNVRQGMLQSSNVNPITSVVNLISVQRQAEMMQRALSAYYSDFNRIAADELPRV